MKRKWLLLFLPLIVIAGCGISHSERKKEIIVFHAGSLAVPFSQLKKEYEKMHPGVNILLESSGSLVCARKITELKKPCDIIASADYLVIDHLLVPEYAKWSVIFATNEIVIAYSSKSRYASEINVNNWTDILLRDDVTYARSDPDSDPCGYRAVFTIMLTEKLHGQMGLTEKMLSKNRDFIRPSEVDLVALVESNACDYMFQYKSVAIQHGLKFLELPDDVNLSDPSKAEIYRSVSMEVTGKSPGKRMRIAGDFINYSISMPDNAPDREAAIDFLCYILSKNGLEIFSNNGQKPVIPPVTGQPDQLPAKLLRILTSEKSN